MSHDDPLGDRMKRYENASNPLLVPRSPLFLRVDGKAFHTWTRGLSKPFDQTLIDAMVEAAVMTASEMSGFKLAYAQSDEVTFALTDFDQLDTEGWFDYRLNKLVSVAASIFTAYFNRLITNRSGAPAFFDCRAFIVPPGDAPNVFVWREKDWARNSVQMLAQSYFSPAQLHGRSLDELKTMAVYRGDDLDTPNITLGDVWDDLYDDVKFGTFVFRDGSTANRYLGYEEIASLITPATEVRVTADASAILRIGKRFQQFAGDGRKRGDESDEDSRS